MKRFVGFGLVFAFLVVSSVVPAMAADPAGVSAVQRVILNNWPTNKNEAAAVFTPDAYKADPSVADRFVQNEFGGWHLTPGVPVPTVHYVDIVGQMYLETEELTALDSHKGWAEICWTILGGVYSYQVIVQGGTFWKPDRWSTPEQTAQKIHSEQESFNGTKGCGYAVGFTPLTNTCKNKDGSVATLLANR